MHEREHIFNLLRYLGKLRYSIVAVGFKPEPQGGAQHKPSNTDDANGAWQLKGALWDIQA
jgi:hypothetical protein